MDNYCSPQWVDFTSTPDVPSDDYFEKNHEIYEYKPFTEVPKIKIALDDKINIEEISEIKTNNEKLETELNIIKNTPIKVIYPPSSLRYSTKCKRTKKITYDDVLHEAIETFEHCVSAKLDISKKQVTIKNDASKPLKFHAADNKKVNVLPNIKVQLVTDDKSNKKIQSLSSSNSCNSEIYSNNLLKNNEFNCKSGNDNSIYCTPVNSRKSLKKNILSKQGQCLSSDKSNSSKRSKPVTYQCRRQSLIIRRRSNQFISLAAAVHKFQNETPERFHTKHNKDLKLKTASAKRHSFVTKKSMFANSDLKRKSVPALSQKEKKDSKSDEMKEISGDKTGPKSVTKTPNLTKSRRSCFNFSTKSTARNKHVVTTIVDNNSSEIVLKKEKILFFDIPIHTKQKTSTRPIPFSFEYRDKVKKQSNSKQLELEDNKSVNNVKSQNIETKTSEKKIRTGSTGIQNKANQVKKQSSSVLSKGKIKCGNEKIETIQIKEDLNKMKRKCSAGNSINTNTATQENKCPNVNASMSDTNLKPTKNIKPKSTTIGMNSYERGKQRHEYDEKVREKIKIQEKICKKMEADKLAEEKLQIAKLRKQLAVKARPMPVYKPLLPIKSTKPLTEPQSPAWGYKNKAKKAI